MPDKVINSMTSDKRLKLPLYKKGTYIGISIKIKVVITLVKTSRIYTGQYTFPILLLNDDNMLGEHKGREKIFVYGRLF